MSVSVYETTEVGEAVLWGGRHGHDVKRKNLGIQILRGKMHINMDLCKLETTKK